MFGLILFLIVLAIPAYLVYYCALFLWLTHTPKNKR